jgi:transposase
MKVRVRGVTYPDVPTASRKLKVSEKTVYAALQRGTEDTLGTGRGRHGNYPPGPHATPVQIGPYCYNSIREAARELNFSRKTLTRILRKRGVSTCQTNGRPGCSTD